MWILWLKNIYQTLQIRSSILFYKIFSQKNDQSDLVKKRLQSKGFHFLPDKETKVFAIFSVSNWETVLLKPLASLGEVYHFNWPNVRSFFEDKNSWSSYRDQLNERLVAEFDQFYEEDKNMILFLYASDFSISKSSMHYMNRKNVMVISFCWDDLLYFKGKVKGQKVGIHDLSKYADINLTLSPESISRYNYFKSPAFFWDSNEIANANTIKFQKPTEGTSFYVLFVGSNYGWRTVFIKNLIKAGIEVKCFGNGWENEQLSEEQMKEEILKAPVTLGFANIGYTRNVTTIKGRDFEVPLYGGLYLTQYSEGLAAYYKPGKEVFTYKNLNECINNIKLIMTKTEYAFQVRQAGHIRAVKFGSWNSRVNYLKLLLKENLMHLNIEIKNN
jgi:hypothetical protein